MVLQIEHTGKSGPGGVILIPATVGPLMFHQPFDACLHATGSCVAAGEQTQHAPRRLGRSAGTGGEGLVVVTGAALAPSAVGVLDGAKPFAGAQDVRFAVVFSGGAQAAQ